MRQQRATNTYIRLCAGRGPAAKKPKKYCFVNSSKPFLSHIMVYMYIQVHRIASLLFAVKIAFFSGCVVHMQYILIVGIGYTVQRSDRTKFNTCVVIPIVVV